MTSVDFRTPLTPDDPCGPDLELEGDADFLNFLAISEGLLPKAFYVRNPRDPASESKPFNVKDDARGGFNVEAQLSTIARFSERTRDLRLLALAAKFSILSRNFDQFNAFVQAIAGLVETNWNEVNPKGEDGDFTTRFVSLQSLDDNAPVVFPLMYTPLFEDRRFGPVTYRTFLLASGEVNARDEEEEKLDLAAARRIFDEVAIEVLTARRAQFQALNEALVRIRAAFVDKVDYETAPSFDRLGDTSKKIFSLLDSILTKRDPALSLSEDDAGSDSSSDSTPASAAPAGATGAISSFADATAALTAIADYYQLKEPSNPALLLVRQAKDLIGKPFLEVLRILVPRHMEEAVMKIGRTHTFDLPIERLADFSGASELDVTNERHFEIANRDQVLQLLAQVTGFFQSAEPTSPIPLLLERARAMAPRDFISLLKEILPEDSLKSLNS